MVKLKITATNPAIQELISSLNEISNGNLTPVTQAAFKNGAKKIAGSWRAYGVKKESLPSVPDMVKPSRNYSSGVNIKKEDDLNYVVTNKSKSAPLLEYGTSPFDMKKTHPYGKRSRVSERVDPKTGIKERVPYLIIPFRWGSPNTVTFRNTMTEDIHSIVRRLKKSFEQEETTFSENWAGEMQERKTYNWGDSISDNDLGNANGMKRMSSGSKSSTYFTFRIISAKSPQSSWINKGIKARHVVDGLIAKHEEEIIKDIKEGLIADLGGLN